MNLIALEYFVALAEQLNYTKTAQLLYTAQPNVSRQIKSLEDELGIALFTRSKTKVELTPAGKEALTIARRVLHEVEALKELSGQFKSLERGTLKIGYLKALAVESMDQFAEMLSPSSKLRPNVNIELEHNYAGDLTQGLVEDVYDVILTIPTRLMQMPYIQKQRLSENKVRILVQKNHRLADRGRISIEELADEKFVFIHRNTAAYIYDSFLTMCMNHGFSPNIVTYCDDQDELPLLVAAGYGITFTGSVLRKESYPSLRFLEIEEEDEVDTDFYILWKKDSSNPLLPVFLEYAKTLSL